MLVRREDEAGTNRITVRLAGDVYIIRGDDAPEHLTDVARHVEEKLLAMQGANPKLAKTQLAMLVALSLADELCKLRREHEEVQQLLAETR